jgi:hypothetical protein
MTEREKSTCMIGPTKAATMAVPRGKDAKMTPWNCIEIALPGAELGKNGDMKVISIHCRRRRRQREELSEELLWRRLRTALAAGAAWRIDKSHRAQQLTQQSNG